MTKMHKIEVYVIDHDDYGIDEFKLLIQKASRYNGISCFPIGTTEIGEYADDHILNSTKATKQDYQNIFDNPKMADVTWLPPVYAKGQLPTTVNHCYGFCADLSKKDGPYVWVWKDNTWSEDSMLFWYDYCK